MRNNVDFRFHFAISFSGSQRPLAERLRDDLKTAGFSVFYDRDFEHEMIGKDGSRYLRNVYSRESRFCVILISEDYDRRNWTNLERESIQARELQGEHGVLIPVLVDNYMPDWLSFTRIFFDLTRRPISDLIGLLIRKIDNYYQNFTSDIPNLSCFSDYRFFTEVFFSSSYNDNYFGKDYYCSNGLQLSDNEIGMKIYKLRKSNSCRFCNTILTPIFRNQFNTQSYSNRIPENWHQQKLLLCEKCGWWLGFYDQSIYEDDDASSPPDQEILYNMEAVQKLFSIKSNEIPVKELRRYLEKNPNNIDQLHPSMFSEVIQDIFRDFYNCDVKPLSNTDRTGIDLYLVDSNDVQLILAKRNLSTNKVENISSVRELLGTLILHKRKKGCLITTAEFFDDAAIVSAKSNALKEFNIEIDLMTMNDIKKMLMITNKKLPNHWDNIFNIRFK